jgi:uroporphyrin-III C-methyltransferase
MKPEHDDTPNLPPLGPTIEPLASASEFQKTKDAASGFGHEFTNAQDDAPASTGKWLTWGIAAIAVVGAVGSGLMWAKLSGIQEQLARQSADTGSQAVEARVTSKQAEELARETAARLSVTDAKLSEVALQRSQLEELMQSLSRSRDENLVVDIESAIRLAQQQAQLTGSVQPLLAALNSAEQRLTKVAQPRLAPVLRAVTRDIERIKATAVADTPALLFKLDELVRVVDTLPLLNAVGNAPQPKVAQPVPTTSWAKAISMSWWEKVLSDIWGDAQNLIRVSRIDKPEASMLAPDQSYFVRENLKLRLLNARLGLLARHFDVVQSDMQQANEDLVHFFDMQTRQGQTTLALAREVLAQSKQIEIPRVDDTIAALTTAAAGR